MGASTGISPILSYGSYATMAAAIAAFKALIPDPDTTSTSGSQAGGGFLDEISPAACVQLRVELDAILADLTVDGVAYGQYIAVAADATANQTDIVTGLDDLTLANCAVSIRRAGTLVTVDAVITEPVAGTLRVADGAATYVLTAGDIITWAAR